MSDRWSPSNPPLPQYMILMAFTLLGPCYEVDFFSAVYIAAHTIDPTVCPPPITLVLDHNHPPTSDQPAHTPPVSQIYFA